MEYREFGLKRKPLQLSLVGAFLKEVELKVNSATELRSPLIPHEGGGGREVPRVVCDSEGKGQEVLQRNSCRCGMRRSQIECAASAKKQSY